MKEKTSRIRLGSGFLKKRAVGTIQYSSVDNSNFLTLQGRQSSDYLLYIGRKKVSCWRKGPRPSQKPSQHAKI